MSDAEQTAGDAAALDDPDLAAAIATACGEAPGAEGDAAELARASTEPAPAAGGAPADVAADAVYVLRWDGPPEQPGRMYWGAPGDHVPNWQEAPWFAARFATEEHAAAKLAKLRDWGELPEFVMGGASTIRTRAVLVRQLGTKGGT